MIFPKQLDVLPCDVKDIRSFVEEHHYSHSINGVKILQCFKVMYREELVGGVIFGSMSTTAWRKFADQENKVVELRRLILLDKAGKNSESHVISKTIKYIKDNFPAIEIIVSYADPWYGHTGIIYKASNFSFIGITNSDYAFYDPAVGKVYHSRALRTKYKGEYKPFVKKLRAKLEAGLLEKVKLPGKYCYTYKIIRKNR